MPIKSYLGKTFLVSEGLRLKSGKSQEGDSQLKNDGGVRKLDLTPNNKVLKIHYI